MKRKTRILLLFGLTIILEIVLIINLTPIQPDINNININDEAIQKEIELTTWETIFIQKEIELRTWETIFICQTIAENERGFINAFCMGSFDNHCMCEELDLGIECLEYSETENSINCIKYSEPTRNERTEYFDIKDVEKAYKEIILEL